MEATFPSETSVNFQRNTRRSHVSFLYNFGKDRIEITISNGSSIIVRSYSLLR
jgi:hypothetical protein